MKYGGEPREMSGATKQIGAPENRISEFQEELYPDAPGTMISNPEFGPVVTARQKFPKERCGSQLPSREGNEPHPFTELSRINGTAVR